MSNVVKMNKKVFEALKTIYQRSVKNPKWVHSVLSKKKIKKETWITFFELYSANSDTADQSETSKDKESFKRFIDKFTPYGRSIFTDLDSPGIEVDWEALINQ